jgi:hypothetical protein
MLFKAPTKGDDGIYYARATDDTKKKVFVQLNKVKVHDSTAATVTFDTNAPSRKKLQKIETENLQQALEHSVEWFGREMSEEALSAAYYNDLTQLTAERIAPTKIFNADAEVVDFDALVKGKKCNVILEFVGLYFAKSSFGPVWNLVQVKLHADPQPEYPEEFAFGASDDEDDDAQVEPATEPESAAEPEPAAVEADSATEVEVEPTATADEPGTTE